jgi:hypothetical protein
MVARGDAERRDMLPAPPDLHAPFTSLPLTSLEELPEALPSGETTEVHFYFPVEIEVVRERPEADPEAIIEATLGRLAARLESIRG